MAAVVTACEHNEPAGDPGGLAVLAAGDERFTQASPDNTLQFPRDHGAHQDYRIEWWYLTANLEDGEGRRFGAQWTLFRSAQQFPEAAAIGGNPWQDPQMYMAHFAISTEDAHHAFQRYARGGVHGGLARAGAQAEPLSAWLDDWQLASTQTTRAGDWLPLSVHARQGEYALDLRLDSDRALVLQGNEGFSRKHPNGGGSHYYSHPFLTVQGQLTVDGEPIAVTGQAWLDREWSSQFLQGDQSGWDWFSLHLDSGEKLMLFQLRDEQGQNPNFKHGVLIRADGSKREINEAGLTFEPLDWERVAGRDVPVRWRVRLGELSRSIEIRALHPRQWMTVDFGYWEGYVIASGATPGESGKGYLEMVGYE